MTPDWIVLVGAMLTGLLGGAHCAAMCGGIATSVSLGQRGGAWVALQPNLGRIGGYGEKDVEKYHQLQGRTKPSHDRFPLVFPWGFDRVV